jgi:nitroreductase
MVDVLLKRRSCRSFERNTPVPKPDLERILAAGRSAACARGIQELEIVAITNRSVIDQLGGRVAEFCEPMKEHLKQRQSRYGITEPVWCDAPLVVFVNFKGPKDATYSEVNGGAASLNIIAAAEALGYATLPVLMGSIPPQNAAASDVLGIPADQVGLAIAIGKPTSAWKPEEKKQIAQTFWIE